MPLTTNTALQSAIYALINTARRSRQRRLLVLSGERCWGSDIAAELLRGGHWQRALCINNASDAMETRWPGALLTGKQARQLLGRELDLAVYDCWSGLDPDALAAVTGTLCGGGLLVLLVPPLQQWPYYKDPDYQRLLVHPFQIHQIAGRFLTHIRQSVYTARHKLLIEQDKPLSAPDRINAEPNNAAQLPVRDDNCLSDEQARAVAAIIRVVTGHRRRPLVITADRGRGKSSALGIASARLMQQGVSSIVITAPRSESVQPVFEHAAKLLGTAPVKSSCLRFDNATLQFIAPDQLLRDRCQAELLLVDEAAAIPVAMLTQALQRYSRIVFATTVHGYEGSGRGFDLRFRQTLDTITPQWKAMQLRQPIRWADNDPLERWLFDALLLDAQAADDQRIETVTARHCVAEQLSRDQLMADKKTLQQLFGLLVLAHYQTTPADLRNLLDGPNISVWLSRFQGQVVAAALVATEGGFDRELAMAIWRGERRPRGHLLPQTLAAHSGLQQAPELQYWRIMRIAVHPAAQRRGLGRQLTLAIIEQARLQQCDMVGSSFAATADVLSFWRDLQLVPVRLGVSRDTCSGCFAAVVLSSLSRRGGALLASARNRFNEQFARELSSLYRDLESALVAELLLQTDTVTLCQLDQQDWLDIEAFANGYRQYEMCLLPLWKLVCLALSQLSIQERLSVSQRSLLIMRVLQYRSIKTVADHLRLTGKKQLSMMMREAIDIAKQCVLKRGES